MNTNKSFKAIPIAFVYKMQLEIVVTTFTLATTFWHQEKLDYSVNETKYRIKVS
jgi:hypothetical protein